MEECVQKFAHFPRPAEIMCNATWDLILCWPPTSAGSTAYLACPPVNGVDTTKKAFKICSKNGVWQGKTAEEDHKRQGWTNYTECLTPELRMLQMQLDSGSQFDSQMKLIISSGARVLEMVGLTTSFLALSISIAIFCYFRQLRNIRTRIHGNLFAAILVQVTIRLILYVDQFVTRKGAIILPLGQTQYHYPANGIDNTRGLCEGFYVLLEYARTAMFMWMFIEGVYLHSLVTSSTLHYSPKFSTFRLFGWGVPLVMTASWAIALTMSHYRTVRCWWGYSFTNYFWILEGPRLGIIAINFLFLVNIVRVLVTKLRESNSSEAAKIRKACRAAIVLLPLLGITNCLGMVHSPLKGRVIEFAFWIYCTQFLTSFQGFFIALFYCFINGEVRSALSILKRRNSVPSKRNNFQPAAKSSTVESTEHIATSNV